MKVGVLHKSLKPEMIPNGVMYRRSMHERVGEQPRPKPEFEVACNFQTVPSSKVVLIAQK